MQLIYAYARRFRCFHEQAFTLVGNYEVRPRREGIPCDWSEGIIINQRGEPLRQEMPENILSLSAIVGRNATGKTNFIEMLGGKFRHESRKELPPESFFLLYACHEPKLFYVEASEPEAFGRFLSWMGTGKICCAWCEYDSESGNLIPVDPASLPNKESTAVVTLCERGMECRPHRSEPSRRTEKGKKREYIKRHVKSYHESRLETQARVVQCLFKEAENGERSVLHDNEYSLEFLCDMSALREVDEDSENDNDALFPRLYCTFPENVRPAVRLIENILKSIADREVTEPVYRDDLRHQFQRVLGRSQDRWLSVGGVEADLSDARDVYLKLTTTLMDFLIEIESEGYSVESQIQLERLFELLLSDTDSLRFTDSSFAFRIAEDVGTEPLYAKEADLLNIIGNLDKTMRAVPAFSDFVRPIWVNISDGELWYIRFFATIREVFYSESRIVSGKDKVLSESLSSCILLLDEPETHMHPELARNLLSNLTQWVKPSPVMIQRTEIQIILTTHSPFLLSDILKENVLILNWARRSEWQQAGTDVHPPAFPTYAANFYSILMDSLILESGYGELALKQILDVKKKLLDYSVEIDVKEKRKIQNVIRNVGEQLVKNDLTRLYEYRFGCSPDKKEEVVYF